ncbi:MAG: class I SAM-dependent methyltransferase [bacterium]|nr:class I SAM-dependent methyltransferase [bacterium]
MLHSQGLKESSAVQGGTALALTLRAAQEHFAARGAVRLLDVGCGAGSFLKALPSRFNGVGIDCNGLASLTVNISYEPLPFPDASFDMVTAWQVFEHLENPFFAGREIRRVLSPGGILIMSVPNIKRLRSRFHFFISGGILRWSKHNDHLFVPLDAVLRKTIFQGFNILGRLYADGPIFVSARSLFAKNKYYVLQKTENQ